MTLSEAFMFKAGNGISQTDANANLTFIGLEPTDLWNPDDAEQKCAFYGALLDYLSKDNVGVKSESEGGYSKTYDTENKGSYLMLLANESGCQRLIDKYNSQPKIVNKSYIW